MKIAVISTPIWVHPISGYGGLEVIAWECARGLAAKGHQVKLMAPDGSTCPGVEIVGTGPAGAHDERQAYSGYWCEDHKKPENERRFYREGYWPKLKDVDVIIDHSWAKHPYLLKLEGAITCPILGVFHAPVNTMYQTWPPQCPGLGVQVIEKPCAVCISEDQASHLETLHSCEARVCYNGIDLDLYKPIELPRTDRYLFLARFSSVKGPDIALEACYQAGVGLDLIGDTQITNEPDYLQKCKEMALRTSPDWDASKGKQFNLVGGVSRGETVWWFSQAKALVHPTKNFREPFGMAPIEAQLCGCPVIAWDKGAMRETVSHGWLVNSMEELVRALKECQPTPEIRSKCSQWAKKFSLQNMVDRYEELCIEAVQTGGW